MRTPPLPRKGISPHITVPKNEEGNSVVAGLVSSAATLPVAGGPRLDRRALRGSTLVLQMEGKGGLGETRPTNWGSK